jgi:hypothetical protein
VGYPRGSRRSVIEGLQEHGQLLMLLIAVFVVIMLGIGVVHVDQHARATDMHAVHRERMAFVMAGLYSYEATQRRLTPYSVDTM